MASTKPSNACLAAASLYHRHIAPFTGKITIEKAEMWNATEVYQRLNGRWKVVHSHWSYVKPVLKEGAAD